MDSQHRPSPDSEQQTTSRKQKRGIGGIGWAVISKPKSFPSIAIATHTTDIHALNNPK